MSSPMPFIVIGGLMMCSSSSAMAAVMMGGGEKEGEVCTPEGTKDPNATYKYDADGACVMTCKTGYTKENGACVEAPTCQDDLTFTGQTGTFTCESLDDFKPEGATWWGTYINSSVPVSSADVTPNGGKSHTFHELSSSPTEKKYIAMRKTDKHCKMVQFDITKSGNTCSYAIKDAGYAGFGGGGMGANEACTATTDAEVIAKWNAKSPVPTARTAATATGYGLKSLDYSMYC